MRQLAWKKYELDFMFQSTHPHGVRLKAMSRCTTLLWFQSTHPHGVRPNDTAFPRCAEVSIHAPVWGATTLRDLYISARAFQSTHPYGVRRAREQSRNHRQGFNPRTRMGCDLCSFSALSSVAVSIHAPAWGATQKLENIDNSKMFQSTHPHGVRRFLSSFIRKVQKVSIHAPAWGATYTANQSFRRNYVSIHAPAWGATWHDDDLIGRIEFQSTHPHGVRRTFVRKCL